MEKPRDLLVATERGLYCAAGGFHIDPWQPVERAVITHAHSDHASAGSGEYLCAARGLGVLQARLGPEARITGIPYGQSTTLGDVRISLHPAGHVLGSAQVRVESNAGVWVVSGDYKTTPDTTCEDFAPLRCDVFITESTFGLPIYRWPTERDVFADINSWWRANAAIDRTSIVFAYALGKAQRILAGIDPAVGPIGVHGALLTMNDAYRAAGVALPPTEHAAGESVARLKGKGLIVAPPSAAGSPWVRKFAAAEGGMSAAFASGWMRIRGTRRRRAIDRGFVVSDHADWDGLLWAIRETGAQRIGVTHGYTGPMTRYLRQQGLDAFVVPTRFTGELGEDAEAVTEEDKAVHRGHKGNTEETEEKT